MSTINYQALKVTGNVAKNVYESLSEEGALEIIINNKVFSVTMRTPGNDDDLVRGLLYLEDVYSGKELLAGKISPQKENVLDAYEIKIEENTLGKGYASSRNLLSVSSCGICGKTTLDEINNAGNQLPTHDKINVEDLFGMFNTMKKKQTSFESSGGCHAAAAFTNDGQLLSIREDIGRHNAVDKVVGDLLRQEKLQKAKILLLSGRVSYELVAKAFKAKIPIIAAISAPSSLAVDFAKELGITLLGFCRENRATCYAHPKRIKY